MIVVVIIGIITVTITSISINLISCFKWAGEALVPGEQRLARELPLAEEADEP